MTLANYNEETRRAVINGPRPSPLKLHNASHIIQKPASMNPSSQPKVKQHNPKPNQRQPVIIYTHSPKIIHTKPRDFMALVQKLTGFSRSDCKAAESSSGTVHSEEIAPIRETSCGFSSGTSDEKCEGGNNCDNKGLNPYLAEMPLFTPGSNNFFCSPQPACVRHLDSVFPSPGLIGSVGSVSPTFLEFMKGFPEN